MVRLVKYLYQPDRSPFIRSSQRTFAAIKRNGIHGQRLRRQCAECDAYFKGREKPTQKKPQCIPFGASLALSRRFYLFGEITSGACLVHTVPASVSIWAHSP